jgi:hypothetical protein
MSAAPKGAALFCCFAEYVRRSIRAIVNSGTKVLPIDLASN